MSPAEDNPAPDGALERLRERIRELEREVEAGREIQEALAKSERRYDLAVQGTAGGLWDWEVGTETVYFAVRFKELLGYRADELENKFEEFESRLHPDDKERTMEAVERHLKANVPYDVEYRLRCKNGDYRWFRARGAAIRDEDGKAVRMAGSISDITDRIEATRAAEEAMVQLGAFFQISLDLLCIAGTDGYFKKINPAFTSTLGYTEAELMAEPFLSFVHEDDQAATVGAVEKLAGGGDVIHFKNRYRHKEGHYLWLEWSSAAASDGELIYAVARDVTESLREAEELREAKIAAEAANRAKGEFLANMSHEIRTPMNGIIGMTELLLNTKLTRRQREYQNLVLESAESLHAVLNDVLDFSKIEAGHLELDPQEFDLRDSIGDTLQALGVRAAQKDLELNYHVAPEVPGMVRTDLGRLRQVMVNLVGNGIKFTAKGEVVVDIGLESSSGKEASLHFQVRDTGVGVPVAKLGEIFEPFVQAEGSITRRFGGTGLGLAICRQIVELMGGKIWVESEESVGSTFHFIVRCELVGTSGVRTEPVSRSLLDLPVLVADDNSTNRAILGEMLTNWELRPTLVASGAEALAAIGDNSSPEGPRYPLVLLDVMMPEMDGITVAKELRRACSDHPPKILFLSSAGNSTTLPKAGKLGAERFLTKPVKQSDLLDAITKALGQASRDKGAEQLLGARPEDVPKMHILLAEDGHVNQVVATRLLEKRGHEVTVAENGRAALEALESGQFDAILMDIQMPVMNGFEATKAIREEEQKSGGHIPIIAMTANAMKGDREACLEGGMDGYVAKPVRAADLYRALEGGSVLES